MNANTARYPIARPGDGTDTRSTIGLTLDVAAVIDRYGYPAAEHRRGPHPHTAGPVIFQRGQTAR